MIEPIDFSANDNEFLSSDLKQQVLAFSIIWAVIGFALSAWLFMGKKIGPASLILDRRQAEGRVVDASSHGSSTAYSSGGFSSSAPKVRPYVAPRPARDDEWKNLARLQAPRPEREEEEEVEKPVEKQTVVVDAEVETAATAPLTSARPTQLTPVKQHQRVASENPDRLLYPVVTERPDPKSLSAVARDVEQSMIRMVNVEGLYHVGLIVDGSGKALVSDSFLSDGSLERVTIDGRMVRAELIGRDPEYGLALIQLPPGNYGRPIPLAPNPPARGEELLAFGPSPSRCLPTTVRAGVGFGTAGYLLEGFLGSSTWGSPLLNSRGELVGCHFSSLPDFPGSGVHLAADSAAVYRMLRGYNSSSGGYEGTLQEAYSRLTSLAGETRDEEGVKKGRILARVGVSQFFIGMSPEEANQWVSSPTRTSGAPGVENWRSPAPPLELVFVNNRLVAVATDFTGFSTITGLSMGARIDRSVLSRSFDQFLLVDGLALTPGLDILLDREGKARQFVVRPEL